MKTVVVCGIKFKMILHRDGILGTQNCYTNESFPRVSVYLINIGVTYRADLFIIANKYSADGAITGRGETPRKAISQLNRLCQDLKMELEHHKEPTT